MTLVELDEKHAAFRGQPYVRTVPMENQERWRHSATRQATIWHNAYVARMQQLYDLGLHDSHYLEYFGENPKMPYLNL